MSVRPAVNIDGVSAFFGETFEAFGAFKLLYYLLYSVRDTSGVNCVRYLVYVAERESMWFERAYKFAHRNMHK